MMPIGAHQEFKRKEFQRFLFVGFLDRRELEAAIQLQYPDLTVSQKRYIHKQLDEMETLMTKSSKDITAAMVMVDPVEQSQLAFNGWMQFHMQRAQEWDVLPPNPLDRTYDSEPCLIDTVDLDEEMLPRQGTEIETDLSRSDRSIQGFEDF